MAVDLLTNPGGLFRRLSQIFFAMESINTFRSNDNMTGVDSVGDAVDGIITEYSTRKDLYDGLFRERDSHRSSYSGYMETLRSLAERTIIEMVNDDNALITKDIETAIKELQRQMIGAGTLYAADNDVDAATVSATAATVTGYTNIGNGKVIVSVNRPDGRSNELVYPEVMELICTSDGQQGGGGTARKETFSLRGENAIADKLDWQWPDGSGAFNSLTVASSGDDATANNLLYNSDFDSFTTTNQPDYWGAPLVGAVGTDILEEATTIYRTGGKSLEFVGTGGAPLSSIAQSFAATSLAVGTSGTTGLIKPNTIYHWCCAMRKSAGLAAGVVEMRLINASNAQITDDASVDIKTQVAHGTLTTSFALYGGAFFTPKSLPSTVKFNLRLSTALTSGESVFFDDLTFVEATEAYVSGPYVSLHGGSTDFAKEDKFNLTIANDRAGEFQDWFGRSFNLLEKRLQLPSDTGGAETIADSLIA